MRPGADVVKAGALHADKGPWDTGDDPSRPTGPRNPWTPPRGGDAPGDTGPKPSALDELLRRGREGLGGGGGNRPAAPRFPTDRPFWLYVIAALIGIWLVWSSVHRLEPAEQGVVTRLGKFVRTVGPGGIQLTLPAPFEVMTKIDTEEIRTMLIGSPEANQENLVLTGDQNLVDLAYQVRWSIKDPELFEFELAEQEETIQEVAESAMRATVANFTLTNAIGPGRSDIEAEVQRRMQDLLDQYQSGVKIDGIAIRQADPPAEVDEAFKEVNSAKQERESYQNDARAYAQQVLEQARGESAAFDKVYEQYRLAPGVTRQRMYYDTMERVLGKVDKTIVEGGNVTPYLPLPELRRRARTAAETPPIPVPGGGPEAAPSPPTTGAAR